MDLLLEMQARARVEERPVVNAQAYPEDHKARPHQQLVSMQAYRLAQYLKHVRKAWSER